MGQSKRESIDITSWSNFKKYAIICAGDSYWDAEEADGLNDDQQEEQIELWSMEWQEVDRQITDFDGDKSYCTIRVVLKHLATNKFYEIDYAFSYHWDDYERMTSLDQVFARPSIDYR